MEQASKAISKAFGHLRGAEKASTDRAINTRTSSEWFGIETFNEPELEKLVREATSFTLDLRDRTKGAIPRWLTIVGTNGTGKTMAARRIWRWWNRGGSSYECPQTGANLSTPGMWVFWPKLSKELREREFGRFNDALDTPFLIVDEIGGSMSGFLGDKLSELLGSRVGKWTLITSNLFVKDFAELDPRISSRIIRDRNVLVTIEETPDYALRNR